MYKIGYTKRKVSDRIKELKTANPGDFKIEDVYVTENYAVSIERSLHRHFKIKKIEGEWFELDQSDVEKFSDLCQKYYETFELMESQNTYLQDRGITFK